MARLTRGKAIRAKCLDCCCGQSAEVRNCTVKDCPLYIYRMGKEEKEICSDAEELEEENEYTVE